MDKPTKKPKLKIHDLAKQQIQRQCSQNGIRVRTWSYKLYKMTENINDAIPNYRIDNLPECYNESLPEKAKFTIEENDSVMRIINLN